MKFSRILVAVMAGSSLIWTACGGAAGGTGGPPPPPPPPPTGTNYTTCAGQQVPNWQSNLFTSSYQAAIQALVNHVAQKFPGQVGYIRVGLGRGGEINLPPGWNDSGSGACYGGYAGKWDYTVGNDASFSWNAYLQKMVEFEGGANFNGSKSPIPLLVSITPVTGANPGTAVDDFIAPIAVQNGLSYGNQGLEASDLTNQICAGDWCHLFASFPPAIAELQTLGQSCPSGSNCGGNAGSTGPLPPLLSFATAHGANDFEIYYNDWLIAYDPTNPNLEYQAAIQKAANTPGVQMQVLVFADPDNPDVLNNVIHQSTVTGAAIDVEWSDFDLGNGNYDFTITDPSIQTWVSAGKKVSLILQNTTYGGSGCPSSGMIGSNGNVGSNCAMPPWMWTVLK